MRKKIFVTAPANAPFDAVRAAVKAVLDDFGAEYVRLDYAKTGTLGGVRALPDMIGSSDLVIADLTGMNPFVLMEVGAAIGQRKPLLTLTQSVNTARIVPNELVYQGGRIDDAFIYRLSEAIRDSLSPTTGSGPGSFAGDATEPQAHAKKRLFVSYSHTDKEFLDRLMIHLRPLQRKGMVDLWADTRIAAGADWKAQISHSLAAANIAILLISADFLASDFIANDELPPLLAQAELAGTRIIPVILKPSGFQRDPVLSRFQAINDFKAPLIGMDEAARETVFAKIAELMESEVVT
jgi:hypothetical protein